jgi:tetratricopeptide (TPR) repeat protein
MKKGWLNAVFSGLLLVAAGLGGWWYLGPTESADPERILEQAESFRERGEIESARRAYESILSASPDHPKALNNLGVLLASEGTMEKAEDLFRKAVRNAPEDEDAQFNLVRALAELGRYDEAMNHLQMDADSGYLKEDVFPLVALILSKTGERERAERVLTEGLGAFPRSGRGHLLLARLLQERGNRAEALTHYIEAAWLSPFAAGAPLGMAEILAEEGKIEKAREHWREAQSLLSEEVDPDIRARHQDLKKILTSSPLGQP